jgi:hypothetical protein
MEGEGFMRAAHANKVDSMVVRGISDLLEGKAEADKSGSRDTASNNVAAFAFQLLALLGEQSVIELATQRPTLRSAEDSNVPSNFWSRLRDLLQGFILAGQMRITSGLTQAAICRVLTCLGMVEANGPARFACSKTVEVGRSRPDVL